NEISGVVAVIDLALVTLRQAVADPEHAVGDLARHPLRHRDVEHAFGMSVRLVEHGPHSPTPVAHRTARLLPLNRGDVSIPSEAADLACARRRPPSLRAKRSNPGPRTALDRFVAVAPRDDGSYSVLRFDGAGGTALRRPR